MAQPIQQTDQPTSRMDTAKEQAANVGQDLGEKASELAQTAAGQAKQVTAEAGRQARGLISEARTQAGEQATVAQQKLARGLRSLSDELRSMSERGDGSGPATELAHEAADRTRRMADWFEQRRPGDLLDEVRRVGREHPGTFLLGAVAAGVLAGRLTRGIGAASDTPPSPNPAGEYSSEGQVPL